MSSTPTLAVLNDLFIAEPPSPMNVTASSMDITAPLINDTAPSIDVTAPLFMNVTTPPINIIAPSIKVTATINYGRDLVTLVKMYTEESKYSGKDNNFNCKLIIFNNFYNRVDIL